MMALSSTRSLQLQPSTYRDSELVEFPDFAATPYVRPADWLPLPALTATDEKVVGLVAVFPDGTSNFLAFTCNGQFSIDWGDGTVESFGPNIAAVHQYNYNNAALVGSECSRGYRQAVFTITRTTAGGFGTINFQQRENTNSGVHTTNLLDIAISSLTATSLTFGGGVSCYHTMLEQASIYLPNTPSLPSLFSTCYSLRSVPQLITGNITSMGSWFQSCYSLEEVKAVLDGKGTNTTTSSMFNGCSRLRVPPTLINMQAVTNTSSMFSSCFQLRTAPIMDTSSVRTWTSMFQTCLELRRVQPYSTSKGTAFVSMFASCAKLAYVPDFDVTSATSLSGMFNGCRSLKKPPAFVTTVCADFSSTFLNCESLESFPNYYFGAATTMSSYISGCGLITSVPALNLPLVTTLANFATSCRSLLSVGTLTTSAALTSLSSSFSSCTALLDAPSITNTSAVTVVSNIFNGCQRLRKVPDYALGSPASFGNAFLTCSSLEEIPAWAFGNAGSSADYTSMFGSCVSVKRVRGTGFKFTFSVAGMRLGGAELNEVFNALAVTTGQTLTISNNPGTVAGSGIDRTIATNKGWTVSG